MIFEWLGVGEACVIHPQKRGDERGFFARVWCQNELREQGLDTRVVQANVSLSREKGTLRGLHYQVAPAAETKFVRCTRGAIYDVVLDLRPHSPTRGTWAGLELREEDHRVLYVPEGFAHGFLTLRPDTEVHYMVSAFYSPSHERGVRYDDPAFAIAWPEPVNVISEKDRSWPDFRVARAPERERRRLAESDRR